MSATANPQVALYTFVAGAAGNVSVEFGADTNYGLTTWSQPIPEDGVASLLVAGMKANSLYHLRAVIHLTSGEVFTDVDHVFMTGTSSLSGLATIATTTTPSFTPQSGVELLDPVPAGSSTGVLPPTVTDLSGNVLWAYDSVPEGTVANPVKLIPNGHFLMNFSGESLNGIDSVLEEVDLAGTVIWQMTASQLNSALASATCAGCNVSVVGTHHDFVLLPSGHLIVIASTQADLAGTTVTGDVIIDLDQNHNPVWVWNEFDHLDINRRPMGFPDWTHTNALLYSADDGNLIVSIRHQNWLVKVDYENGSGSGAILWKLGYQGDFQLVGGTDPTDWFYAQHGPSFVTPNTTGQFSLILFDNGNDRVFPPSVTCGTSGAPACLYSTVPLLHLDETAMTATLALHLIAPAYSFFGGNAAVLENGDVEYCDAAAEPGEGGTIYEVTQGGLTQTVWEMGVTGEYLYRGQRIPSLYPGVQW